LQPNQTPYTVDPSFVTVASDKVTFEIENRDKKEVLLATVTFLDGTARLHINDKNPVRPRHEVEERSTGRSRTHWFARLRTCFPSI
jgi:hypothetical protein